jgi:predicted TIM-barrel fold metal-dependent hydrolase
MIVDSQIHLWKAETEDWKWTPGSHAQLEEPFTIERALRMMDEAGVDRAVIVPPSWTGDRNDYGLEAHQRYPQRFAVMGRLSLKNPANAALVPSWRDQPGMLGIRLTFLGPNSAWLKDGTADWFWPVAETARLPVMYLALGAGGPAMAKIAERHPELPLIVDHMGMVKGGALALAEAVDGALSLAKYPNVSVKMSAIANNSREPYPFRDYTPHIKRIFDAFGPERSYWGTDITNGLDHASYTERVTSFLEETANFLSKQEQKLIMGDALLKRLKW